LVSLAHKAAANVISANRISIMDMPLVPPMVPASAVAMMRSAAGNLGRGPG
jgi:hypothetical protein